MSLADVALDDPGVWEVAAHQRRATDLRAMADHVEHEANLALAAAAQLRADADRLDPPAGHALTAPGYLAAVVDLTREVLAEPEDDGLLPFDRVRPGCHVWIEGRNGVCAWHHVVTVHFAHRQFHVFEADIEDPPWWWYEATEGQRFTVRGSF